MGIAGSMLAAMLNVVFPALAITLLSPEEILGPSLAFLVALVLPLSYGVIYFSLNSRISIFSLIGLISVILTGSFGIMQLSPFWMIAKETGIPLVIGLVIIWTGKLNRPFMGILLTEIMDMKLVEDDYASKNKTKKLKKDIRKSNSMFASVFFVGAALNFFVAFSILSSEPGTPEYASEVGRFTAISYPLIVVPVIVMLGLVFAFLASDIEKTTGKDITDYMKI